MQNEKLDECGEIGAPTVCLQLFFEEAGFFFMAAVCTFWISLAACPRCLSRNSDDRFLAVMNHRFCQLWRVMLL